MQTWNSHLYAFYKNLRPPAALPPGIQWLYPQQSGVVMDVLGSFLERFYDDSRERKILLGINPGRFGAGMTGVNFTAPRQLTAFCDISHPFGKGTELSAEFIYAMIEAFGGVRAFYGRYFIGSVCPLGFTREGRNLNYYDDKALLVSVEPFIVENLHRLMDGPRVHRKTCYSIGGEKNFKYLQRLNTAHKWFKEILPLPHPRFIMQYRRKQLDQFIQLYLQCLSK